MEVREPDARYVRSPRRALTELGELPVDWRVAPLDEFEPVVTSGSRGWAAYYSESGAVFLRITNLSRSRIYPSVEDLKHVVVPEDNSERVRTALQVGDVLISITADIGMIGWVPPTLPLPAYINQHIALLRIAYERANSRYVAYFLAGAASQRRFKALTDAGAKAGMSLAGVRQQVLVALPPPAEQQAIAEALSDADDLIESLSLLLAKKRQIKQGAMQELLTGKRRLPGFNGAWSETRLSQLGDFLKGRGVTRDQAKSGHLPCVRYGEIYTSHGDVIQRFESWISPFVASTATRLRRGDILFAGSGETKEEIGKCTAFVADEQAYAGGDIVILRTRGANASFLSYLLNTPLLQAQKASRGQGDAVVHISSAALAEIEVRIPGVDEQAAIALAISQMDEEIGALQVKLSKARDIKQGMMQTLLTGRIRLMQPTPSAIHVPA